MEQIQLPPDNEDEFFVRHSFRGDVIRYFRRIWWRMTRLQRILIAGLVVGSCSGSLVVVAAWRLAGW
jgi:hypothetical protein